MGSNPSLRSGQFSALVLLASPRTLCTDVPERCCLDGDPLAFQLVGPRTGQSEGKGLHAPGQPLHLWAAQSHDPYWSDPHSALGGCKEGAVESFREMSSLHDEGKPPTVAVKGASW